MDCQKTKLAEDNNDLLRKDSAGHVVALSKNNDCDNSITLPLQSVQNSDSLASLSTVPLITGSEENLLAQNIENITDSARNAVQSDVFQDVTFRTSMDQALKSEKAFVEYVMSLPPTSVITGSPYVIRPETAFLLKQKQKHSSNPSGSSNTTKVGLDHLDNLCKLMEQLSELRETNSKLQKRVQYLEDLKTLHEMHKELRNEVKYGSENVLNQRKHLGLKKCLTSVDYVADSPRGSEDYGMSSARGSEDLRYQIYRPLRGRTSPSNRRSKIYNTVPYDGHRRERSKSVGHEEVYDSRSKRIFPKWSRVKEAFGWESERKYAGTKVSKPCYGTAITNIGLPRDARKILTDSDFAAVRVPIYSDYSEKDEMSPTDSYAGEAMASCTDSGIPVLSSSTEDLSSLLDGYRSGNQYSKRDSGSSENKHSLLETRTDVIRRLKSATAPGSSRMYHELLDQKKSLTIERSMDAEQAFARFEKEESKKSHKSPWGRVKTIIERRRDSLKRKHLRRGPCLSTPPRYHDQRATEEIDDDSQDITIDDPQRKSSSDQIALGSNFGKTDVDDIEKKRKKQTIAYQSSKETNNQRQEQPPPPIQFKTDDKYEGPESRVTVAPEREVVFRTPGSSPQFHRKSTWMRMKNVLRSKKEDGISGLSSQSMPSSPNGVQDNTFDFEDVVNPEENTEDTCYENGRAITRVGSDSYVHKLALSSKASPVTNLMIELQRNVSDDFSRKMQEWERIRNAGMRSATSPKLDRDNHGSKFRKKPDKPKTERYEKSPKPKVKDLVWLEKELQKIEKEKKRLSKEKEKYEERAIRLERLRQTVLTARTSNKKEVLVRTSAGEFRFEGISDAFTKKLYEWETKRGLGSEFSTIALLDSSVRANNKNCLAIQQIEKCNNLQRAMSRSESSVAEIGQPSHTSSNSLPSLKPPEINDVERIHHSRANSEPDLSSFTGVNNVNVSQTMLGETNDVTEKSSRDTLEADVKESYAHPEVTQLIDSDVDEVFRDMDDQGRMQRDENYYSLLEENVILLEQLKNKEEICRRLEKELNLLDGKVEEMNKHHQQEMEKYREKLWEMHKPGNTPWEVQGCIQVMTELRSRIDNLEKCSEKLRNEKETLEDSFRFHSAEQEHMTLDLIGKMRELQAAGENPSNQKINKKGNIRYQPTSFDIKIVERLQDLSNQLVKQTKELEEALAERTRQICQLRWELLHRDVSTVKLETELHSAHIQGTNSQNSKCDIKRAKYAHFRSWSSEEASNRLRHMRECSSHVIDLKTELPEAYYKLPKTEIQAIELSNTVHELNRELIRLSSAAESLLSVDVNVDDDASQSTGKESMADYKIHGSQSTEHVMSSDMPSTIGKNEGYEASLQIASRTDEAKSCRISVRRNSASSISLISATEHEENHANACCNLNKSISNSPQKLDQKPVKNIYWSESDSSTEEETFTRLSLYSKPEKPSFMPVSQEAVLVYPISKKYNTKEYITDSEDSHESDKEMNSPLQTRKRKVNHKPHRNTRKQTKACESHLVQTNEIEYQNYELMNAAKANDINRKPHVKTNLCLHQCNERQILQVPVIANKTISTMKKGFPRIYKSHSDRRSDSKPTSHEQIKIRKSESLLGTKDRKISKDYSNLNEASKIHHPFRKQWDDKKRTHKKIFSNSRSIIQGGDAFDTKLTSGNTSSNNHEASNKNRVLNKKSGSVCSIKINSCSSTNLMESNIILQSDEKACNTHTLLHKISGKSDKSGDIPKNPQLFTPKTEDCVKLLNDMTNMNSNTETQPTYTIKLPKRKSKTLTQQNKCNLAKEEKIIRGSYSNLEPTITVVLPKTELMETNTFLKDHANPTECGVGIFSAEQQFKENEMFRDEQNDKNMEHISQLPRKINNSCMIQNSPNNIAFVIDQTSESHKSQHEDCKTRMAEENVRKTNYVSTNKNTITDNQSNTNYFKSPSDTQIDWKRSCAKKISKESAPNVKTLIEKYNQKVLESQTSRTPCSSAYSSPTVARKISAPTQNFGYSAKNIPYSFSSTPSSPRVMNAHHYPMLFKPITNDSFHSSSPPASPCSRTRSAALLKAKENFISSSSIAGFKQSNISKVDTNECVSQTSLDIKNLEDKTNTQQSEMMKNEPMQNDKKNRTSMTSNKSFDSMSLVLCRTGETCQESRLSKKNDKQKNTECVTMIEKSQLTATKSLSSSSIFKSFTSREIFPSSLFRLRRSRKKKDMGTVSQLCRQSLMLDDESFKSPEEKITKSPRSCPSSPETQSKNKVKASWLTRNLFRHK